MSTFKNSVDPGQLASKEARLIWIHTDFFFHLHPMSPIQANLHTLHGSMSTVAHDQLVTALDYHLYLNHSGSVGYIWYSVYCYGLVIEGLLV